MHRLFALPAFALPVLWLMASAAPAAAADPVMPSPSPKAAAKTPDPNQIICEYIEDLGSRLSSHKICATRAEWAQRRQDDRAGIDRGQVLQQGQGR